MHHALISKEAQNWAEFYQQNYDQLIFQTLSLESNARPMILGSKPQRCKFCGGGKPERTFKKTAHAVSELLGNQLIRTLYECDQCNDRFKLFENELGHATLPIRNTAAVKGKSGVPTLKSSSGKSRIYFTEADGLNFAIYEDDKDVKFSLVEHTLSFTYFYPLYRPIGAYKALCKYAIAVMPETEIVHFHELSDWLLEPDFMTKRVYGEGMHVCLASFVPAFKPFGKSVIVLLRRKTKVESPYMVLFIPFGNTSFQISIPCPRMDSQLAGKRISLIRYPHLFDFQPWLTPRAPEYYVYEWDTDTPVGGLATLVWSFDSIQEKNLN